MPTYEPHEHVRRYMIPIVWHDMLDLKCHVVLFGSMARVLRSMKSQILQVPHRVITGCEVESEVDCEH